MSTLKTVNIGHPSADEPAIVLDAAGGVAVAGMGLVHINTTSFTAVSSVSLNDVFTTTYDYYTVRANFVGSSSTSYTLRLRASGTDNSTTNYRHNAMRSYTTLVNAGSTTTAQFGISNGAWDADAFFTQIDFFNPRLASKTGFQSQMSMLETTGAHNRVGGMFNTADVFDGFTLIPAAGNITGTIRVFGYNNG